MNILFYVLAAVLAGLNLAGLAQVSWWLIVGLALAPLVIGLAVFLGALAVLSIAQGGRRR
ncbi:hypothetical protein UFOVP347_21 [uncultured Caudovirales phage]|uniref:Uncharacterized protein n=1 Tax=uncultured Caudovirales phage TaxID=2100421 RepID=A0A6J5LZF0_9CAUD|nr:hypothetical protein UFOVP347_21 [uncultured Caudovirales phage]